MKILILNWRCWLHPEAGGAEVFTREVAKRWAVIGNDVTLFSAEFEGCKREEIIDGVRIVRAGGRYSVYRKAKEYYRKRFFKDSYDVVIDEINTRPFLAPKFVLDRQRIVALIHQLAREYWFYETPFPMSYIGYHLLEKRWLRNYVKIPTVTVSESTQQDLLDLGFQKVFVVPEGLNFKPLDIIPEKECYPVVAYVGRLKKAKRPDHAVKAFKIVKEKLPDAELWIVGDGYFRKDLQRIAGDNVRFFSGLDNLRRRELMKRAWVLVNPSIREGWGLNVVEANALGTPCVAYNVAGLRDSIRNGSTGLLVENATLQNLAEKIIEVLTNDVLRTELSWNAIQWTKQLNWDTTTREFTKVLKSIVNEN